MTYAKIDDAILEDEKILDAGEDAANLFIRAIIYCNRNLTDGFIHVEALRKITERKDAPKLAAKLVEVELFQVAARGWQLRNFEKWNKTKSKVLEERRAAQQRMRRSREQTANGNGTGGEH